MVLITMELTICGFNRPLQYIGKRSLINVLLNPLFQKTCSSESSYNTPEIDDGHELSRYFCTTENKIHKS